MESKIKLPADLVTGEGLRLVLYISSSLVSSCDGKGGCSLVLVHSLCF